MMRRHSMKSRKRFGVRVIDQETHKKERAPEGALSFFLPEIGVSTRRYLRLLMIERAGTKAVRPIPTKIRVTGSGTGGGGTVVGTRKKDSAPSLALFHTAWNNIRSVGARPARLTVSRVQSAKPLPLLLTPPITWGPWKSKRTTVDAQVASAHLRTSNSCSVSPAALVVLTSMATLKAVDPSAVSCATV